MIVPTKLTIVKMLYAMAQAASSEEHARWFLDAAALLELEISPRWNA